MSTTPFLPADDPRAGTCGSCGALLAADQRYCLSCGARRDHARLPFQDALVPAVTAPAMAGPPPAHWYPPPASGLSMPTLLSALACVLVAFGVGLLVGGGGGNDQQQPIVVGATPGATAAPVAAPTTTDAAPTTDTASKTTTDESDAAAEKQADAKRTPSEKQEAAEVAKTPARTKAPVAIDEKTKKDLTSKDPEKAREASQGLPDAVSTGG